MAIDSASGQIIWKTAEWSPSNFVLIQDTVYSLRENAALVANDAKTGQEKGHLEFSNGPLDVHGASEYWPTPSYLSILVIAKNSSLLSMTESSACQPSPNPTCSRMKWDFSSCGVLASWALSVHSFRAYPKNRAVMSAQAKWTSDS
jgi:hypothetical protein